MRDEWDMELCPDTARCTFSDMRFLPDRSPERQMGSSLCNRRVLTCQLRCRLLLLLQVLNLGRKRVLCVAHIPRSGPVETETARAAEHSLGSLSFAATFPMADTDSKCPTKRRKPLSATAALFPHGLSRRDSDGVRRQSEVAHHARPASNSPRTDEVCGFAFEEQRGGSMGMSCGTNRIETTSQ